MLIYYFEINELFMLINMVILREAQHLNTVFEAYIVGEHVKRVESYLYNQEILQMHHKKCIHNNT